MESNPIQSEAVQERGGSVLDHDGERAITAAEAAADRVEAFYLEYRLLLIHIACRKFRVPERDAEGLIQEVFLAFLRAGTSVVNVRAWLVAAVCNASRHYVRSASRVEPLPDDYELSCDASADRFADQMATNLTVRQAIGYLQPRCRETLWLHYYEGRTAKDMALALDTSPRYAEKLIHNCLERVRRIYLTITNGAPVEGPVVRRGRTAG